VTSESQLPDLAILSVATNRYLNYWEKLVISADRLLQPGARLNFYVFTDNPDHARNVEGQAHRSRIIPIEVPALGWPEATLLRYELFSDALDQIREPIVIHLDADMLLTAECIIDPGPSDWPGGIAVVRHPGFRRPSLARRLRLYLAAPRFVWSDIRSWFRFGALGTWEASRASRAYVPRRDRHVYVCGGTWMGFREPISQMIRVLAIRTRQDLSEGVIAVWHDESHLNWFVSITPHYLFDSEKCFAPGYRNLLDLAPEILAVDKGTQRTR
jgi:hypothetical protein